MKMILILFAYFIAEAQASASCTQTLSTGADVVSAISSAAGGSTICLNSGDYGSLTLSGVSKSSAVTIQSTTGRGAIIGFYLSSSNNLTFQNLQISVLNWSDNKNTNMKVLNNTFIGQAFVYGNGNSTPQNNVISGNTFDDINENSPLSNEGRLQLYDANDLIISNNHFGNTVGGLNGNSDGIQAGGHGGKIGPGNVFEHIYRPAGSSTHVDAIQLYGQANSFEVYGNYFTGGGSYLFNYSETVAQNYDTFIHDNVFVVGDYYPAIQNAAMNVTFKHNTMIGVGVSINGGSSGTLSLNAVAQNNLFTEGASFSIQCSDCTISNNMFDQSGVASGVNNIIGIPTFVGGASPATWAGYMLMSNSIGSHAGTDGLDMGSNYFGTVTSSPSILLAAPTNLRITN
ncbi:MAG: hypothetical protein ACXWRA_11295 [Pseudobdellovibrionaceae bacterium]